VILPPMTDIDRTNNFKLALADRQAVFQGSCIDCHIKRGEGKYGKSLYDADCAICHEGEHRATMVPDLHQLKAVTSPEFWRVWIAHGKAGSLMPAFSNVQGGPLSEEQIDSIAGYLNLVIPARGPNP
jgi:mono/diheme cytochrome c family protein